MTQRICVICGTTYEGKRGKYCPACARAKANENARKHSSKAKAGEARRLGDTAVCENCGKEYLVAGGLQRYCKACSEQCIKQNSAACRSGFLDTPPEREGGNISVDAVCSVYRRYGSIKATADSFGISSGVVKKCLVTGGLLKSPYTAKAVEMKESGMTIKEIALVLKITPQHVCAILPYSRGTYLTPSPTRNAEYIRNHRKSKKGKENA